MELSHIDASGNAKMVYVGDKDTTSRTAVAEGKIFLKPETLELIGRGEIKKGNVINTAKVAAILAAKQTSSIIPLCHNIPLNGVDVDFVTEGDGIRITASAYAEAKTGAEMEALCAVSVAALTIYDMVKAVDKAMEIGEIRLLSKTGGKSQNYSRKESL